MPQVRKVTDLDTVELTRPGTRTGVYVGAYHQFDQPGTYDVFVYASDDFGAFSLPKATTVVVDPSEECIVYIHSSGDCGVGREPCYNTVQKGLEETGSSGLVLKIAPGRLLWEYNGRQRMPLQAVGRLRQRLRNPKRTVRDHRGV